MNWQELNEAISDARMTVNRADQVVREMANMTVNRLRTGGVGHDTLCALKKELEDYNMHTGKWKPR